METLVSESQSMEDSLKPIFENLISIIDDPEREGVKETPKRMAKAYSELISISEPPQITIFQTNGYDEMIIDRDIPFYTFCEHHVLPFFGTVSIGYLPKDNIAGLSKLDRVVKYFSQRLNTQEYMTKNIAEYLDKMLKPQGVGVIIKARHLCKEMRGVKSTGEMRTSELLGRFRDQSVRQEFLSLTLSD